MTYAAFFLLVDYWAWTVWLLVFCSLLEWLESGETPLPNAMSSLITKKDETFRKGVDRPSQLPSSYG
jgi:hypothetical protein